ncbi:MAG TPA: hypothetical protein VJH92_04030, partial [Candidatus Nanoarchaeia archaeon]|nr:hypothetical protein [Candidatus Nanoarchaeia archaeon]
LVGFDTGTGRDNTLFGLIQNNWYMAEIDSQLRKTADLTPIDSYDAIKTALFLNRDGIPGDESLAVFFGDALDSVINAYRIGGTLTALPTLEGVVNTFFQRSRPNFVSSLDQDNDGKDDGIIYMENGQPRTARLSESAITPETLTFSGRTPSHIMQQFLDEYGARGSIVALNLFGDGDRAYIIADRNAIRERNPPLPEPPTSLLPPHPPVPEISGRLTDAFSVEPDDFSSREASVKDVPVYLVPLMRDGFNEPDDNLIANQSLPVVETFSDNQGVWSARLPDGLYAALYLHPDFVPAGRVAMVRNGEFISRRLQGVDITTNLDQSLVDRLTWESVTPEEPIALRDLFNMIYRWRGAPIVNGGIGFARDGDPTSYVPGHIIKPLVPFKDLDYVVSIYDETGGLLSERKVMDDLSALQEAMYIRTAGTFQPLLERRIDFAEIPPDGSLLRNGSFMFTRRPITEVEDTPELFVSHEDIPGAFNGTGTHRQREHSDYFSSAYGVRLGIRSEGQNRRVMGLQEFSEVLAGNDGGNLINNVSPSLSQKYCHTFADTIVNDALIVECPVDINPPNGNYTSLDKIMNKTWLVSGPGCQEKNFSINSQNRKAQLYSP